MSGILGFFIDEYQGAFIPGRQILDNVLIVYEIFHGLKMKRKCVKGNFTLKLDMSKAYDHVEWDFVASMMSRMGFHINWIALVMRCVYSVSYIVGINDSISQQFSPSKGLRQGDPLSPYLLLICVEGFSKILNDAKQRGAMKGVFIGKVDWLLIIYFLRMITYCLRMLPWKGHRRFVG